MKPFFDKITLGDSAPMESNQVRVVPKKVGYGVEFRRGRDIANRKASIFISSGRWAEMPNDGLIDQQITQLVFGESIDPLDISPFSDYNERQDATSVLKSGEVLRGKSLDYEGETSKDGRITIFDIRPRGYVVNEEIPYKTRGLKVENETILGYSVGSLYDPFLDGGGSSLGITREGFYGIPPVVTNIFEDKIKTNGLGFQIDTGDYNDEYETGAHGNVLYSSAVETDSIAFYGLLK